MLFRGKVSAEADKGVNDMISRQKLVIPTYEMDEAEKAPVFYDVRNHQGTRGNIYPIPMTDTFKNVKTDREYDAIRLENEFIRVTVLPQLGGRIYEGYDKKADYHFVYKNNVIKPALIGLCGAWISGGIEFNWPQHHRPTTFMPVDSWIETGEDGSETAWMGEYEPLFGMKGMVGVTIWPGKAYVTVKTRLYNPTNAMQTFHWWANLAVHANQDYQLQFPPDVDYITYHYKDAVSPFPVVRGEFARADFGEGTDITWFKNIPSPASFFILNSDYNFMGGYDHGRKRGTVHVADHHVSVGKKFFTWGSREFGDVWHSNLTDEDGAYLEIMTGCYTDNQPDFSFMAPDETKTFEQTWYALSDMPGLKNAGKDGAVGFVHEGRSLEVCFNVTAVHENARMKVVLKGETLVEEEVSLEPGKPVLRTFEVPEDMEEKEVSAFLYDEDGKELISYTYRAPFFENREKPVPHKPAREPKEIGSQEELYLEGLHLEQYRHVTLRAQDYYMEALHRDPGDSRCNNAMGLLMMRRGNCREALRFMERAVKRCMLRNPNPRDGEYCFNYAWALEENGQEEEAVRYYRKAAWNYGYKGAGLKQAAKLSVRRGDTGAARDCVREALTVNGESPELFFLQAFLLRKEGRTQEAEAVTGRMLGIDPMAYGSLGENWFLQGESGLERLQAVLGKRRMAWLVLMASYLELGAWEEVLKLGGKAPSDPMVYYDCAYAAAGLGKEEDAAAFLKKAGADPGDYCFPYTDMDKRVLEYAYSRGLDGGRSAYYLGCLYYGRDNREEGMRYWEDTVSREDGLYQAHRCLALALLEVCRDKTGARREMEKAFALKRASSAGENSSPSPDGRYLLELMEIRKQCGVPVRNLLELLEEYPDLVYKREDLYHQQLVLYNEAGMPEKAAEFLKKRIFNPYEGGEGILVKAHILAYIQLGRRALREGKNKDAIAFLEKALEYPENYHEGRGVMAREAAVYYHMAKALEADGRGEEALAWYEKAAAYQTGRLDESDFYTACALRRLGKEREAAILYRQMLEGADALLEKEDRLPYFGGFVSNLPGEHDVRKANHMKAHPAKFYAYTGLGRKEEAEREKKLAAYWGSELAWLSIIEEDGGNLGYEGI